MAVFCGAWLFAGRVQADELYANAAAIPATLQISVENEIVPNLAPVPRAYVTAGTNKFAFLVPGDFRVDANNPALDTVSLISSDFTSWLTLRIAGPAPSDGGELESQPYRELLLSQYPGATILDEFSLTAAGRSGPAFNLQKSVGGVMQSMRVAFIPSDAGVLEFSLLASRDNFPKQQAKFNALLLTFRASVDGKLEIPPVSDKT